MKHKEIRCEACNRLLFKNLTGHGLIEVKCPKCKHQTIINLVQEVKEKVS